MVEDTIDGPAPGLEQSSSRLKILLSAYACAPTLGSEPAIGWNTARGLTAAHDVWLLTYGGNRELIEQELTKRPIPQLSVVYHDLPAWFKFFLRGNWGEQLSYYLWQVTARPIARAICARAGIQVAHHITFGKFWAPICLTSVPVPYIIGPMGGGESASLAFWSSFGPAGIFYEIMRSVARWFGEHDYFVRSGIRRSAMALATSDQTLIRLQRLGARRTGILCPLAFFDGTRADPGRKKEAADQDGEIERLMSYAAAPSGTARFVAIGRLIHWKGVHLSLYAFAEADIPGAEFWIIGDGAERARLLRLATELGIVDRVSFLGRQTRNKAFELIAKCHVLVMPSLHDSSGWVCLEAMAIGRPVICLNTGGPAHIVSDQAGIKCRVDSPAVAIADMANAMKSLSADPELRRIMGLRGQQHVLNHFSVMKQSQQYSRMYADAIGARAAS